MAGDGTAAVAAVGAGAHHKAHGAAPAMPPLKEGVPADVQEGDLAPRPPALVGMTSAARYSMTKRSGHDVVSPSVLSAGAQVGRGALHLQPAASQPEASRCL